MSAGTLVQFNRMDTQMDMSTQKPSPDQSEPCPSLDDAMEVDGPAQTKILESDPTPVTTMAKTVELETKENGPEKQPEGEGPPKPATPPITLAPILIDLDEDESEPAPSIPKENPDSSIDPGVNEVKEEQDKPPVVYRLVNRKIDRKELEHTCGESVVQFLQNSTMGVLKNRVTQLTIQRDKLDKKCTLLQNQVNELSKAIQQLTETYSRNPKGNPDRTIVPIKFYRNVAMSVNLDGPSGLALKSTPQKARGPCPNSIKIAQMSNGPAPTTTVTANGPIPSVSSTTNSMASAAVQHVKRVNKPTISVTELRNQIQVEQNKMPRKIGPLSALRNIASPAQIPKTATTKPATNGIIQTVDLTEDSPAPTSTVTTQAPLILNQNGVRYQVINAAPTQTVQLVQSGAAFQFVTPTPQGPKPLVFQQQPMRGAVSQPQPNHVVRNTGPVVFRTVNQGAVRPVPNPQPVRQASPLQKVGPRPITPPLPATVQINKNGTPPAVVPKIPYAGIPGVVVTSSPKKFTLPEFPSPSHANAFKKQKEPPPHTDLTLTQQNQSIVLSWIHDTGSKYAEIVNYQIYSCQEPLADAPKPGTTGWKRVGDVKALPLPMACTLSQFTEENRYYFIVRAVDVYNRTGPFCEPKDIVLKIKS